MTSKDDDRPPVSFNYLLETNVVINDEMKRKNNINVHRNSMSSRQNVCDFFFQNHHFNGTILFLDRHWSSQFALIYGKWPISDVSSSSTSLSRRDTNWQKNNLLYLFDVFAFDRMTYHIVSYHSNRIQPNRSEKQWQIRIDHFWFDHHHHHLRLHFFVLDWDVQTKRKVFLNTQDNWSFLGRFEDVNSLCNQDKREKKEEIPHDSSD